MKGGVCEEIECEREISSNGSESVESVAFGTASFASLETCMRNICSQVLSRPTISETLWRGPGICVFTSPPDGFDAHSILRTTNVFTSEFLPHLLITSGPSNIQMSFLYKYFARN